MLVADNQEITNDGIQFFFSRDLVVRLLVQYTFLLLQIAKRKQTAHRMYYSMVLKGYEKFGNK